MTPCSSEDVASEAKQDGLTCSLESINGRVTVSVRGLGIGANRNKGSDA
jgi:hypothetical protein